MQQHDDQDVNIALEAKYNLVYRQQGIRFINQLKNPKLFPFNQFLPFDFALYHYFVPREEDVLSYGISQDHPLLHFKDYRYGVFHIGAFSTPIKGPNQKRFFNFKLAQKAYHKHNNKLFWVRTPDKMKIIAKKRPWQLIIDYSMMGRNTKFRPNPYRFINEYETTYSSYLNEVATALNSVPSRRHILFFHIPDTLPTMSHLRVSTKELKRTYYKFFPSFKELALLDFWRWLTPDMNKQSLFGKYINERHYDNIEIMFTYKGHATLLNLGMMYRWFAGKEALDDLPEDESFDDEDSNEGLDVKSSAANKFKKWFYIFLKKIIEKQNEYARLDVGEIDLKQNQTIDKIYDTSTDETLKDEDFDVVDKVNDNAIVKDEPIEEAIKEKPLDEIKDSELSKPEPVGIDIDNNFIRADRPKTPSEPTVADVGILDKFRPEKIPYIAGKGATQVQILDNHGVYRRNEENQAFGFTQREQQYWDKQANVYKTLKSPVDKGKTLEQYINESPPRTVSTEDTSIPDIPLVLDKTMLDKTVKTLDKKYIKEHLKRDTVKCLLSVQRTGVNVTNYEVEDASDVASQFEDHVVQFTPVGGSPTTVRIRMPKVDPDTGYITAAGTSFSLRKQRVDAFLRKVDDNKVSMTSYYGKLFFNRNMHRKYNQEQRALAFADGLIHEGVWSEVKYGVSTTESKNVPMILRHLMTRFRGFTVTIPVTNEKIQIDLSNIQEKGDKLILGHGVEYNIKKDYFIYKNRQLENKLVLGFDESMLPNTFAEVKILGEMIPVGFILGRWVGFAKLIDILGLEPEKYESVRSVSSRIPDLSNKLIIKFIDEVWVFDKTTMTARDKLILGGFLRYDREIKQYSVYDFSTPDVYGAILQQDGISIRYERELDLIFDMFIDPITHEYLVQKNLSTDIVENFILAVELLTNSKKVDEINMDDMLIKGHERVAGAMYRALVSNLRVFKSKAITHKRKFQMGPLDAWLLLSNDPAMEIVDEINPIQNIKERTNVTFMGEGGRSRRSMVQHTRSYHKSDIGVISEATVDSLDVGVTTFLAAAPNIKDTFGNTERVKGKPSVAKQYSAAVLATPFGTTDDAKRLTFVGTQASHRIPIRGGMPIPIRTGYENVIAHNNSDIFAFAAEQDGEIKQKLAKTLIVVYKDGTEVQAPLGLRISKSKGYYYKHEIVCDRDVGYKFKKGEILSFNTAFYVRDVYNMTQVIPIDKTIARTILMENNDTFEDSSAVSDTLSRQLSTSAIHEKTIVFNCTDHLSNIVEVGEDVDVESPLMIIQDQAIANVDGNNNRFSRDAMDLLIKLSNMAPKAGTKGRIVKRECFYFCEEEELSSSINEMVNKIQTEIFGGTKMKVAEKRVMSGKINEPLKFGKDFIGRGQVAVRYYIEHVNQHGGGDKLVFCAQLKSVSARRWTEPYRIENGREIHAMFSYASISNRIVGSPELTGTTNILLRLATERALRAYDGA